MANSHSGDVKVAINGKQSCLVMKHLLEMVNKHLNVAKNVGNHIAGKGKLVEMVSIYFADGDMLALLNNTFDVGTFARNGKQFLTARRFSTHGKQACGNNSSLK